VASLLKGSRPEIGTPVRFDDTLAAFRALPGV
jgi:hypothetical protein